MSNTTVVQTPLQGAMSLVPLLQNRLAKIISRKELETLSAIEARAEQLQKEKADWCSGQRQIEEAVVTLRNHPTPANRERFDVLTEKYVTPERCNSEEDIRISHLAQLAREVPAVIYVPLKRVHAVLVAILDEEYAVNRKSFARIGVVYDPDIHSSGDEILNFIRISIHRLGELLQNIKRGRFILAETPVGALHPYFDLTTVKKDSLSPTLPVPVADVAPCVIADNSAIDRATGRPLTLGNPEPFTGQRPEPEWPDYAADAKARAAKRDIPGVTLWSNQPRLEINSDGEFSRQMATVSKLPERI